MFQASLAITLGDGHLTMFWTDRWLGDRSPCVLAPDLCKLVRPAVRKHRTVAQGLANRAWTQDIAGVLTIQTIEQYLNLWPVMRDVQLQQGREDVLSWRWCPSATYLARSAYRAFFLGSARFPAAKHIWNAWAPLKVKFFVWLAANRRIWTADRRHRLGLQDWTACKLCDQEQESVEHLFITCPYTRAVWHAVLALLGPAYRQPSDQNSMLEWWWQFRRGHCAVKQKGLDSIFMLVTWCVWKERNGRTFSNGTARTESMLVEAIVQEGQLWASAGAKSLAAVGWPSPVTIGRRGGLVV
ncbi:unnamed protein product [Urochloa humidicola]